MINNFFDLVPKYYVMDPNTEDLLFDGSELRNGMVVLAAEPFIRYNTMDFAEGDEEFQWGANEWNRWCTVSRLVYPTTDIVEFVGIYADDTKLKRAVKLRRPWYVKADSITGDGGVAR